MYRTFPHISKGANLTIHCVCLFLNRWSEQHNGKYPTYLYIQCDGGSENANQTFLGFLELLVAKRYCKFIQFSRLQTGHGHADDDRGFSVSANFIEDKTMYTPQDFKKRIIEAYENNKTYGIEFNDISMIPDYETWLKPYLGIMKRAHRMEHTQHCFRYSPSLGNKYQL